MGKGKLSLKFIIAFALLLIAVFTVLGIFFTLMRAPDLECEINKPKIVSNCKTLCNNIKEANNEEKRLEMVKYCSKNFESACKNNLTSEVIVRGSGYNSFCSDRAYCFNFPQSDCVVEGRPLNKEYCLEIMCKTYMEDKEFNKTESESKIRELMKPGSCELKKESHDEILVETWWEKFYENPTCSGF